MPYEGPARTFFAIPDLPLSTSTLLQHFDNVHNLLCYGHLQKLHWGAFFIVTLAGTSLPRELPLHTPHPTPGAILLHYGQL